MIYTDGSYITADNESELHEFAKSCGMSKNWFQNKEAKKPNRYWIFGNARKLAMRSNPKYISSDELQNLSLKMVLNP